MSTHTATADTAAGYTTTGAEKALAAVGILAGGFFVLVCLDLLSGGRLSAPVRAAAALAPTIEEVLTGDDIDY